MSQHSLRHIVKTTTGQDVYKCRECQLCDLEASGEMDVPFTTIIQMIMFDDDEVLTCRTVWSDSTLEQSSRACKRGLNLKSILQALRTEAQQRGVA